MALTDNIVLVWELNDATSGSTPTTCADASGNGRTGTVGGGATWMAGKVGAGALSCAGDNDKISLANASLPTMNGLTFACWANVGSWINLSTLASRSNGASPYGPWDIRRNDGVSSTKWEFLVVVGGTGYTALSPTVTIGGWQHYAFTYDGETMIGYVNGSSSGGTSNATPSGNISSSQTSDLWVCGNPGANGRYIDCDYDQVALWSDAKSAAEILSLYNSGSGLAYSSWGSPSKAGIPFYSQMRRSS
jgi:hypothetical protein